jgi:type VI secretion system protein ImpL
MQSVFQVLTSRWLLSFVGTAIVALLVWFFAPLVEALEGWQPRLAIVLALLAIWLASNLLLALLRRGRERSFEANVTARGPARPGDDADEEAAALRERMSTALTLLKKVHGSRANLYEQPWYAIIGPPGAGKTTALLNSGLKFPLAEKLGHGAVGGVGGTRLCDWWFTENAVLIDTAGRYTTQDSNATVDRAGWHAFLDVLRRTRPRQPLNGVIVAIALSEIAEAPSKERTAHAREIRSRIKELESRLGVRMPVYALFTKADLIAGFTEFFDDLDREGRSQAWGVTFPLEKSDRGTAERFPAEFQLLVERLNQRLFRRLQEESSVEGRALISSFPTQIATLEPALQAFLVEAFGGSQHDPAPVLRGVYFASGTQEGTPIDRLTGTLVRTFGLDRRRGSASAPDRGRSYFLGQLLSEVILGEAMLVSEPPGARARRTALRVAAFAVIAVAVLGAGGWLAFNRWTAERDVHQMSAALAGYESIARTTTFSPVDDSDLPRLLPLLDAARDLQKATGNAPAATLAHFDFSQAVKLRSAADTVYRHALGYALLPRLIWRLEAQMRGSLANSFFLYEATRVYLMLGGQGPLDPALVKEWMAYDWQAAHGGAHNAAVLAGLATHLDALLAQPLPAVTLDEALVARARTAFSNVPLAARVYSRLKPTLVAQALPPWRPSEALGRAGQQLFVRASGKKLSDGVPGYLTVDGFNKALLPAVPAAVREASGESWITGQGPAARLSDAEQRSLVNAVITLYANDYIKAWDELLQDLEVAPLRSVPQAAQDLFILGAPQSPMKELLTAMARQLALAGAPQAAAPAGTAVAAVMAGAAPGQAAAGSEVDEYFKPLRDLVAVTTGTPIDQVLKRINDLQQQMAKLAAAGPVTAAQTVASLGNEPLVALRAEARKQPQPMGRWLQSIGEASTALRGGAGGARQQVIAAYNGSSGPAALCPLAVNGRFPFVAGSTLDTPVEDFAKLFAPGGLIDGFFNTQLRPFVDATGNPWKGQSADGVAPPVSAADIVQFQRAAVIRTMFFAPGSTTVAVRFDVTPVSLDAGASRVSLELDGASVVHTQGAPPRSTEIIWPGPDRLQSVRLVFDPPPPGGTGVLAENGPWSMFRLFGRGTLAPASAPGRYTLTFTLGNRRAVFDLKPAAAINPFALAVLQDFRCPSVRD